MCRCCFTQYSLFSIYLFIYVSLSWKNGVGERVVAGIARFSAGKPIVRKLTSNVGARCTTGQFRCACRRWRRIRGSRERHACRGVNFNTPSSFFPLSSARPPTVLAHEYENFLTFFLKIGQFSILRHGNSLVRVLEEKQKKKNKKKRVDARVCSGFGLLTCSRSLARLFTRNSRATWHACRDANCGRGLRSALLLAGRVCAWTRECVHACVHAAYAHATHE